MDGLQPRKLNDYKSNVSIIYNTRNMIYSIKDIECARKLFHIAYLASVKSGETKMNYYCGITNDLSCRKQQHKVEEFIKTIECDSFKTSSAIEKMLEEEGFNVGKSAGHGRKDSVFVYMYKIVPGMTCESLND